ncbi:hypothetical protein OSTOST_01041 [Ostertagia ostertagi]
MIFDDVSVKTRPDVELDVDADAQEVDVPTSTRAAQVWKHHRLTTVRGATASTSLTYAPGTLTRNEHQSAISTTTSPLRFTHSPLIHTSNEQSTSRERTTRMTPAVVVANRRTDVTTAAERLPTSTQSSTITIKPFRTTRTTSTRKTTPKPLQATTEEVEYEIVEVEVDENGNEIEGEKLESSVEQPINGERAQKVPNAQRSGEVQEDEPLGKRKNHELGEQEERRKLVEAQKRALNLPVDTEVEYFDNETTNTADASPDGG